MEFDSASAVLEEEAPSAFDPESAVLEEESPAVAPPPPAAVEPAPEDNGRSRFGSAIQEVGSSFYRGIGGAIEGLGTVGTRIDEARIGGSREEAEKELVSLEARIAQTEGRSIIPPETMTDLRARRDRVKEALRTLGQGADVQDVGQRVADDSGFEPNPKFEGEFLTSTVPQVAGSALSSIGQLATGAGPLTLFSQVYQDTLDRNLAEGIDVETAHGRALRNGIVSGGLESVGTGIVAGVARRLAGSTAAKMAPDVLKGITTAAAAEFVTGAGQETASELIDRKPLDPMEILKQGGLEAMGGTMIAGPVAVGALANREKAAAKVEAAGAPAAAEAVRQTPEIGDALAGVQAYVAEKEATEIPGGPIEGGGQVFDPTTAVPENESPQQEQAPELPPQQLGPEAVPAGEAAPAIEAPSQEAPVEVPAVAPAPPAVSIIKPDGSPIAAAPLTEGPHIISTVLDEGGGIYLVGDAYSTPHQKGVGNIFETHLAGERAFGEGKSAFLIQDESGEIRVTQDREEAARIAEAAGQRKGGTGKLQSEDLDPAWKPAAKATEAAPTPVTPAVAAEEVKTEIQGAKRTWKKGYGYSARPPKEIKAEILAKVAEAKAGAVELGRTSKGRPIVPDAQRELDEIGKVTIEIPGDGKFSLVNTKEVLEDFEKRVKAMSAVTKSRSVEAPSPGGGSGQTDAQLLANRAQEVWGDNAREFLEQNLAALPAKQTKERAIHQEAIAMLPKADRTDAPDTDFARTDASTPANDAFERARAGDDAAFEEMHDRIHEGGIDEHGIASGGRYQVHTAAQFETLFEAAFKARDFEKFLRALKASDLAVWKPLLKKFFAEQKTDPVAALKADWMRHAMNGTWPADAAPPKPEAPPPTPGPTPRPRPGSTGTPPPAPLDPRIEVDPIPGGGGKSPYRILEDFSAALGKALRVRKGLGRRMLGVYRPASTMTANRFAGDLDTAAHELAGHWLDDKHGIAAPWFKAGARSPYDSELAKFWIHGSVAPSGPRSTLKYKRAEGVAEFVRAYVMNPTAARLSAPKFTAYFEKTLPAEAMAAVRGFSEDVRRWAGEDPVTRGTLNIRMEPPTIRERLWRTVTGRGYGFETGFVDKMKLWFDDDLHYFVKSFKAATAIRGITDLKPEQNAELMARLLSGHDARISDQFENGLVPLRPNQTGGVVERTLDPVTNRPMTIRWLLDAFDISSVDTLQKDMAEASAFMVAERTLEKVAQLGRESNVSGLGAGMMSDKKAAEELLAKVASDPTRQAKLKEAARRYREWAKTNIQMLVDAGRITRQQARDIQDANEFYVDMHRLSDEFEQENMMLRGGGFGTVKDVVKKFKGSTLEIDNVYRNLLEQTDAIQKEAHRNVVMNAYTDMLTQAREMHQGAPKDLDQFGSVAASADENTIRVFKNGKAVHWKFEKEIRDNLRGLGELGTHAFVDLLAIPTQVQRYLITHSPQFIARNPIRDAFERAVVSRNASKPWDVLKGYSKEELSSYELFGGGQFGNYIRDRVTWNRELKRTMRDLADEKNIFLSPLKLKRGWERLAEASEKAGRIAEFRRAFDRAKNELGYDDYNASLYAAAEARGLIDYAKAGTVMRVINRLIPFSNAHIRGLLRAYDGVKENPAAFSIRWGMYVLLPTALMLAWNRADDDNWEEYNQLPAYQRDLFWNFKVGPYWIRIPKPHTPGVFAGGVERALLRALGDKAAMEGYGGMLAKSLSPVGGVADLAGPLKTLLELKFNRDTFRDRDIIPSWEREQKLELRKGTGDASNLGQSLASVFNETGMEIDPRQVDHVLQSYGGIGQTFTDMTKSWRSLDTSLIKSTGFATESPGVSARDVQFVLDWARENGALQSKELRPLKDAQKALRESKGTEEREYYSRLLREQATLLREAIEGR